MVTQNLPGNEPHVEPQAGESSAHPIDSIGGTNTPGVTHDMSTRCNILTLDNSLRGHNEDPIGVLLGKGMV